MKFSTSLVFFCVAAVAITEATKSPRVINGERASLGQFPWQVEIINHQGDVFHHCTGAFISEEWILTAAHCIAKADYLVLTYGVLNLDDPDVNVTSSENYVVHEDYDETTLRNDIGLIYLDEPIAFNDIVNSVALAEDELQAGTEVTVSGWGATSADGPEQSYDVLRYITVTTIENDECSQIYGADYVSEGIVCTDGGSPVKNPCQGDGGAPGVVDLDSNPVHVGVFSFISNLGCDNSDYPAGFTRTAYYRDWIKDVSGV